MAADRAGSMSALCVPVALWSRSSRSSASVGRVQLPLGHPLARQAHRHHGRARHGHRGAGHHHAAPARHQPRRHRRCPASRASPSTTSRPPRRRCAPCSPTPTRSARRWCSWCRSQPADGWLNVYLPIRPDGAQGCVQAARCRSPRTRTGSSSRATRTPSRCSRTGRNLVFKAPIGVGTADTPTPGGNFYIKELLQPPNPDGAYGPYAYGLSGLHRGRHRWRTSTAATASSASTAPTSPRSWAAT